VFAGGLEAAKMLLQAYGLSDTEAKGLIDIFAAHDKSLLETTMMQNMDFDQLIAVSKKGRQELQNLFKEDKQNFD
jgi:CPA2 family monovalent cation:H+ antiporter-2